MDPWTIVSLIALALGTGAQVSGERKRNRAFVDQAIQLRDRKRRSSEQANAIFNESLMRQDVDTATQEIDEAAEDKVSRVEELIEQAPLTSRLPGQDTSSKVVQSATQNTLSEALARSRARLGAVAELEGFGDRTFNRGIDLSRAGAGFTDVAIANRGADALFNSGMQVAQGAGANTRLLGDVLTSLGTLGLGAGNSKLFQGGAKPVMVDAPITPVQSRTALSLFA